jgi:hypothetical protein
MSKVAISFHTKDATESAKRVVEASLLQPDKFDLFWLDGSDKPAGQGLPFQYKSVKKIFSNVRGSGDYAVVFALSYLLDQPANYTHIGICEDDILMPPDWFDRTMALFDSKDLNVGIASPRAYEDRILIQRDGYAVMHNTGYGVAIYTRAAAEQLLQFVRTGWTLENRRTFAQLAEVDIAKWWAFQARDQWLCTDWGADASLAAQGFASLALTPSPVEMIHQKIPLEAQGLRIAVRTVDNLRDGRTFSTYCKSNDQILAGVKVVRTRPPVFHLDDGGYIYFAHQLRSIGATWSGEWFLNHQLGFGPFNFTAGANAELYLKLAGPCDILYGGPAEGGKCRIRDLVSGFEAEPENSYKDGAPAFVNTVVPAGVSYRAIHVDRITPGSTVYGVKSTEAQPVNPQIQLTPESLPAVQALVIKEAA